MTIDDDTARAFLRRATRPTHVQLERQLRLTSPGLSLAEYTAVLGRFHSIYNALESLIECHAAALAELGLNWPARRKAALLSQDLATLGACSLAPTSAAPPLDDLAQVLGCLYVTEGATLGGQVICDCLQRSLRISGESGASFFSGYGAATAERWQELCVVLERALLDPGSRERAARTAEATFRLFAEPTQQQEPQ